MILKSISYSQFDGSPEKWHLNQFTLQKVNLIVGRNATGKSRTLNIIKGIAKLVSGDEKLKFMSGNYELVFVKGKTQIEYELKYEDFKIVHEKLIVDGKKLLTRNKNGKGKIYTKKVDADLDFQVQEDELVCVNRRDSIQHPFFEDLYEWGSLTRYYPFGTQLGKDKFYGGDFNMPSDQQVDLKKFDQVVEIFHEALSKYDKRFTKLVKDDMKCLGYEIEKIDFAPLKLKSDSGVTFEIAGLSVKEKALEGITKQNEMSQGMFRALSLIIQLNYSQLESESMCILVDDIGEGLDFERSKSLINLLIEKVSDSPSQLIMTTNDRFVMNNVPLEYWQIMNRSGSECVVVNYENSKKVFDDFEFTGLSNFDFFSSDFYSKGFDE